jgi:spore coat protein H
MRQTRAATITVLASLLGGGCGSGGGDGPGVTGDGGVPPDAASEIDAGPTDPPFPFARCGELRSPMPPLVEDRRVYQQDALDVWTVDVQVDDLTAFAAVNAGEPDAEVAVIFTDGAFGAGVTTPNATLRLRGGSSRFNAQKNYKIEIADNLGRWHGQKEINLNKHMSDVTRVRNKLAFDLFATVPGFPSIRTHFVQLRVNGDDYGLYTWIEELDHRYLESHGLDPAGTLYKAVRYFYQPIDAATAADPEAFRLIVEGKASPDDDKLLRMTAAINDTHRDIDSLVDQYFQRDNLVNWLAVNVLLNSVDNRSQNFYLYSPSSCDGFYLLPWDYDGAFGYYAQLGRADTRERWRSGLANYWGISLWQRFLEVPANRRAVEERMDELAAGVLADARIGEQVARYRPLVEPFISRAPDLQHLPGGARTAADAIALWQGELTRITPTVSHYLGEYRDVVERPMPVFQSDEPEGGGIELRWDFSYDVQGDPITYELQISRTTSFAAANLLVDRTLTDVETIVSGLPSGDYPWRVIIRDGNHADAWQVPFEPYEILHVP